MALKTPGFDETLRPQMLSCLRDRGPSCSDCAIHSTHSNNRISSCTTWTTLLPNWTSRPHLRRREIFRRKTARQISCLYRNFSNISVSCAAPERELQCVGDRLPV